MPSLPSEVLLYTGLLPLRVREVIKMLSSHKDIRLPPGFSQCRGGVTVVSGKLRDDVCAGIYRAILSQTN